MDELVLPSVFRVAEAAREAVTAAHRQATRFPAQRARWAADSEVAVGLREAAIAFRSERYLRVDGEPAFDWGPLSGDYPTGDGWIRLHCNFEHHAAIACRVLGLPASADRAAVTAAVARRGKDELEDEIAEAGGVAAAMRTRDEWAAHPQGVAVARQPLIEMRSLREPAREHDPDRVPIKHLQSWHDESRGRRAPKPLAGVRVLDLTRIIAGPVAGRALVGYGADVTMVRAAHLPTIRGLDLDFGVGKSLRYLDFRTAEGREAFLALVRRSDIVLQSYRPGSLAKLGLGPEDLAAVRPDLVHVSISAYGAEGPWGGRRGFDSLVQMASGIADEGMRASGSSAPHPLPGQILDHAAGWFAAAGAIEALNRGGTAVSVSLARMAHWLDGLGRIEPEVGLAVPDPALADVADLMVTSQAPAGMLSHVRLPGTVGGHRMTWPGPPPFA